MKKKKKKWLKFRHKVIRNLAYWVLYPYTRIKYGVKIEKFRGQEKMNCPKLCGQHKKES